MPKKHDIIEINGFVVSETDAAYWFSPGKADKNGKILRYWIPKSQCEWDGSTGLGTMQMPEWLALEKGII